MERLTKKFKLTAVASALAATLAACGGGSDSTSAPATNASQPSSSTLNTTPRALNLRVGSSATVNVAQSGYTGVIAADLSSCGNIVQSTQSSNGVFVIAAEQAGNCTASFATTSGTSAQLTIAVAPLGTAALDKPQGLAFQNGKLYVANNGNNQVLVYDETIASDGTVTLTADAASPLMDSVVAPTAVALDRAGDLYVSNAGSANTITVYDPSTNRIPGATITLNVSNPQGVGVDETGAVFVSNAGSGTLGLYAPIDTNLADGLSQVTQFGAGALNFSSYFAGNLALGVAGATVVFGDEGTNSGAHFTGVETYVIPAGNPTGMAYFPGNSVVQPQYYVADEATSVINIYSLFSLASPFVPTGVISNAQGLIQPYGIVVDDAGNIIVSSRGTNALQVFDPTGSRIVLTVR